MSTPRSRQINEPKHCAYKTGNTTTVTTNIFTQTGVSRFLISNKILKSFKVFAILDPLLSVSSTLISFPVAGFSSTGGLTIKLFFTFSASISKIVKNIFIILFLNSICAGCFVRLIKLDHLIFKLNLNVFNVYIPVTEWSPIVLFWNIFFINRKCFLKESYCDYFIKPSACKGALGMEPSSHTRKAL